MRAFLLQRLLWLVPSFLGITLVVFLVVRAAPGDPLAPEGDGAVQASAGAVRAAREYRRLMGLEDPVIVGYAKWLGRLAQGDLGTSFRDGRPVARKIAEALPVTLLLSILSLVCAYLVAVPVGVWSAARPGSAGDRMITAGVFLLFSLPVPWLAMLLITLASRTRLLPIQGLHGADGGGVGDLALHLVLPLCCLACGSFAALSRHVRSAMLEVLRQDYVRTARAKGVPERDVLVRHALRNALLPLATLVGLTLPQLVGGAVVVERIFGLPGMGRLSFDAILSRDLPVLMGTTALAGVVTLVGLLVSDLLYALLDPRISVEDR